MSEILIVFQLFAVVVLAGMSFMLVMFHIQTQRKLLMTLQEVMENQADGFSKLLQTALLHLKAPSPEVATQLQVVLEREQAMLEHTADALERAIKQDAEKPPTAPARRVVGYTGPDGKEYRFLTPPAPHMLEGIDKSRLVYAE